MALTFSEGSIGGDIERVSTCASSRRSTASATRGAARRRRASAIAATRADRLERLRHRAVEHGDRARAAADQPAHLVLLPRRSADDERGGAERLRRGHVGPVLHLPGLQRARRLDAHLQRRRRHRRVPRDGRRRRATATSTGTAARSAPCRARRSSCRTRRATGMAQKEFTVYRTHHGPVVREADGKWVSVRLMQEPVKALTQSYTRTKATNYARLHEDDGAAHELVEQHDLRRRRRQHRLLPRQLHPEARPAVRLDEAGGRQRSRHRVEGAARRRREPARGEPGERLALQHQQLAVVGRRRRQPEAGRLSGATWRAAARTRAASTPSACSTGKKDFTLDSLDRRGLRQLPARLRPSRAAAACTAYDGAAGGDPLQGEAGRADRAAARLGLPLGGDVGADLARRVLGRGAVAARRRGRARARHVGLRLHGDAAPPPRSAWRRWPRRRTS